MEDQFNSLVFNCLLRIASADPLPVVLPAKLNIMLLCCILHKAKDILGVN